MWHPHPDINSGIEACGNCTLNISERVVQQHFVVTDVNAGGGYAECRPLRGEASGCLAFDAP
jgi:hypothetical protein